MNCPISAARRAPCLVVLVELRTEHDEVELRIVALDKQIEPRTKRPSTLYNLPRLQGAETRSLSPETSTIVFVSRRTTQSVLRTLSA